LVKYRFFISLEEQNYEAIMSTGKSEDMKISFRVREYGDNPSKPNIEILTTGERLSFLGDTGTLYLYPKDEKNAKKAYKIAEYLNENIIGISFVS
jgi:hypothetical protein